MKNLFILIFIFFSNHLMMFSDDFLPQTNAQEVWFCSSCGHSNPDYETRCNYCGKSR